MLVPLIGIGATIWVSTSNDDGNGSDRSASVTQPVGPPPDSLGAIPATPSGGSGASATGSDAGGVLPPPGPRSTAPTRPSTSPSPFGTATLPDLPDAPTGFTAIRLTWGLPGGMGCNGDEAAFVDMDTGTRTNAVVENDTPLPPAPPGAELTATRLACLGFKATLTAAPGARVGILPPSAPKTFDECRRAADTVLGEIDYGTLGSRKSRDFVPGAAICAVTDQGAVAMAVINNIAATQPPEVSGPLIVWKPTPA